MSCDHDAMNASSLLSRNGRLARGPFVLAVIWWTTRMLVAKFPANATLSVFQGLLDTRPAKLVVLVLDITLIDVFLFFACVALLDLHRGFSVFSLWTATRTNATSPP